jgi:hypothetical protein
VARAAVAATKSTDSFLATSDPRVLYEPGARVMAEEVRASLPDAISTVERRMGGPFTVPVRVYVCATIDSFASYGASRRAGGNTLNHRVFISPKSENTPERLPRLVEHELSHLHLGQRRGLLSFTRLPVWFIEGLGVEVSAGAGAEGVSEPEARAFIARGKTFVPEAEGSVWNRHFGNTWGLEEHMFYRQAGMFVAYLRARDNDAFLRLLERIEAGDDLEQALANTERSDLSSLWRSFLTSAAVPPP